MNQYTIIGNLVRDPETGTTQGGVNWCRFTVAVRRKHPREGEKDAEYVKVTAWRGLGDTCAKYLEKGRKVCVVGVPKASAWSGKDGTGSTGEAGGQVQGCDLRYLTVGMEASKATRCPGWGSK